MNEMLDFVKAMSHPDRLRIIGLLSQKALNRTELAVRLELPMKEIVDHLNDLQQVGAISENAETYIINDERLGALAREKLAQARPVYIPSDEWDEKSKKVLKAHLHADGTIKQVPSQPAKLKVILNYLTLQFEVNKDYTEKEVNIILRGFNEDTAGLRREMVDAGMLARESDGSRYWRVS